MKHIDTQAKAAVFVVALLTLGALASRASASKVVLRSTLSGTRTVPFPGDRERDERSLRGQLWAV